MKNNIKELEIKNFKSIKHIKFNPKRVNVFIGKPNVGKSNILEGMSLMTGLYNIRAGNFFNDEKVLRYKDLYNLFYDEETEHRIEISTDKSLVMLLEGNYDFIYISYDKYLKKFIKDFSSENLRNTFSDLSNKHDNALKKLSEEHVNYLRPVVNSYNKDGKKGYEIYSPFVYGAINPILRYAYKHFDNYNGQDKVVLEAPFGENLFAVLSTSKELLNEIGGFLEEQGLEFVLDKKENRFIIQKKIDRIVYQVPYSNIADTLRHIIFYLAAIETNKDAVLLFEEPEVHSYPPYIKMLADRIALDEENQYFISTHSPYMLNTLIDSLGDDKLNVVLTYYEDYQTKVKVLDSEELSEMQQMGVDVFFNLDRFEGEKVVS